MMHKINSGRSDWCEFTAVAPSLNASLRPVIFGASLTVQSLFVNVPTRASCVYRDEAF